MQQRDYTYNRQRYTTELQEVQRTYQVPITEYQWKAETHRSWNPFKAPYVAYRLVPQTRWETRSETVKIPVAKVEVGPGKNHPARAGHDPSHRPRESDHPRGDRALGITHWRHGEHGGGWSERCGWPQHDAGFDREANDGVGGMAKLDTDPPKQSIDWHKATPRRGINSYRRGSQPTPGDRGQRPRRIAANSRTRPVIAGSTGRRSIELAP